MWYFVVLDPVQLILFSSEETLMAVTRLPDDIYGSPITESIDVPTRSTRSQQPVVPLLWIIPVFPLVWKTGDNSEG